jgi:hypothetical protein
MPSASGLGKDNQMTIKDNINADVRHLLELRNVQITVHESSVVRVRSP